ncbi:Alpha carbonic anhydrase domain-containing protein [Aphelenchoides fujianensis]|nr:Alpha carbonic anhydrase domain-containing protein [Aphelenchoides fujianensis]
MNVITLQEPLEFANYDQLLHGEFVNTGHSIQFLPEAKDKLPEIFAGCSINAIVSFNTTTIGPNTTLHLVHQGVEDANKLAVLGIFLHRADGPHEALRPDAEVLSALTEPHQRTPAKLPVNLQTKLPDCLTSFVRYEGSLTTPPCSENVTWTIFTDPIEILAKAGEWERVFPFCACTRIL